MGNGSRPVEVVFRRPQQDVIMAFDLDDLEAAIGEGDGRRTAENPGADDGDGPGIGFLGHIYPRLPAGWPTKKPDMGKRNPLSPAPFDRKRGKTITNHPRGSNGH